ncbi:MAG TPA: MFS transporter [Candidatus Brocadiia bacterium]|nr:MFS transporter [Candidatus Brocadiia bacterium]
MSDFDNRPIRLPYVLRALRHRNFRLFFFGQGLSLIGTWMQNLAVSWLLYRLTGDKFLLGLSGFVGQIPHLIFAPVTGVFADRVDRRKLLIATQALSMVQAAVLSALVLGGWINDASDAWTLIGLSFALGLVNSVDVPVRQAFVADMVDRKDDFASAVPLTSLLMNVTRFIGPSLAGIVVAWRGEGLCFLLNSASYLAVIFSLLAMRVLPREPRGGEMRFRRELVEGAKYTFSFPHIRLVLVFLAVLSLIGIPYRVLMPAFAKDVFHGDARTQGFLLGSVGIGAALATLFLASQKSVLELGRMMSIGSFVFGASLVGFAFCAPGWERLAPLVFGRAASELPPNMVMLLAGPALAAVGFGQVAQLVAGNTLLQLVVDDDKRGRVMSIRTVAFLGVAPFGSLLAGTVAGWIGPSWTVFECGALSLVGAVIFSSRLSALRESAAANTDSEAPPLQSS